MLTDRIAEMLANCGDPSRVFPPTDLFNEGWMLRLVLDWFSRNPNIQHELAFSPRATWYSEALLPSAFLARFRGDKLAESWTHADGVIGQFAIGQNGVGDLSVNENVSQLVVTEAKMFSKLSAGVTNARFYDQAARNVACIAEILCRAGVNPLAVASLGFYVVAPQSRIDEGVFDEQIDQSGIREVVQRRVSEYEKSDKQQWYEQWFVPVVEYANIRCISWEEILALVEDSDSKFASELADFYATCLEFNQFVAKRFSD